MWVPEPRPEWGEASGNRIALRGESERSWLPDGENQRIRFEILKVSKANLLGGYFIGPTGVGNVTAEALP